MIVHLIDGTYELFRCFYGFKRSKQTDDGYGAVRLVLHSLLQMLETGATHIGVATDHIIESFRNEMWPGYKTGAGIDPTLWAQFRPLEDALAAFGFVVWPMVELEADDALAAAARIADADATVEKVCIWTPDKDLAQCVRGERVVQIDRRRSIVYDAAGVQTKFGVPPDLIPDYLALVGDSADGYPGISGWGPKSAAEMLSRYGHIEKIPLTTNRLTQTLHNNLELVLLFRDLATLRTDFPVFDDVESLRWQGPTPQAVELSKQIDAGKLLERAQKIAH